MTDRRGPYILVVEDDALSSKLLKDVLEVSGYVVAQASTGPDGLAAARREAPELVVVDIGLPGMDGVEVTRQLKDQASTRDVPVLAVSAYAMPADEQRMRDAGCDAFLTKPLRFQEFVRTVEQLLVASGRRYRSVSGSEK